MASSGLFNSSNASSDAIHIALGSSVSICKVEDALAEMLQYCDAIEILMMSLCCKKYQLGYLWSLLDHLDLSRFHVALEAAPSAESRAALMKIIKRNMSTKIRSIRLIELFNENPDEQELFTSCLGVIEKAAPNIRSFRTCCPDHPESMLPLVAQLNPDVIETLCLWLPDGLSEQEEDNYYWLGFKKLKTLEIYTTGERLARVMSLVASNLYLLERLTIHKVPTGLLELSADDMASLSAAALASRDTLSSLEFQHGGDEFFTKLPEFTTMDESFLSKAEEWARTRFAVGLSGLRFNDKSIWSAYIASWDNRNGEVSLDFTEFEPLWQACYGSRRDYETVKALSERFCEFPHHTNKNIEYVIGKMHHWLCERWSLCARQLDVLYPMDTMLNHIAECCGRDLALSMSIKTLLMEIAKFITEIVDWWPEEAPDFIGDLLWIMMLESSSEWALRSLKLITLRSGFSVVPKSSDFLTIWRLSQSPAPDEVACLIGDQNEHTNSMLLRSARNYMLIFGSVPHSINMVAIAMIRSFFERAWDLAKFLVAFVDGNEAQLSQMMSQCRYYVSTTEFHIVASALTIVDGASQQPIFTEELADLAAFHFWKAQLEACATQEDLDSTTDALFGGFCTAPPRVLKWLSEPGSTDIVLQHNLVSDYLKKHIM